jgi:hypothetical protein
LQIKTGTIPQLFGTEGGTAKCISIISACE